MAYTIALVSLFLNMLLGLLIPLIFLVVGITIHEFAHALVADRLGDPTPRFSGRLTLNPLAHLDPLGSIMLIIAGFGWGKPVPIDTYNFSHPRRDENLVAFAGPLSNIIVFIILGLLNLVLPQFGPLWFTGARLNLFLAFFNLLPLPALDGSHILLNLLPPESSNALKNTLNQYGFIILLLLFLLPFGSSNLISLLISPPTNLLLSFFF